MSETLMFRTPTEFLGRNGIAKMAGLHIGLQGDALYLAPVTSRKQIGRAYLLIPLEATPDVAKAMLRLCGTQRDAARKAA